jgi:hypothetical protein
MDSYPYAILETLSVSVSPLLFYPSAHLQRQLSALDRSKRPLPDSLERRFSKNSDARAAANR